MTKKNIEQFSLKLRDWTDGLDRKESLIEVFSRIRDIPYAVVEGQLSLKRGPARILKEGRGSCVPKHYLLGIMFGALGIKVRYCIYPFRWKDAGLDYPDVICDLGNVIPVTYHLACRAMIGGKWILLDATWDSPLQEAGFPVNGEWDGVSDTTLAVVPEEELVHDEADSSQAYIRSRYAEYSLTDKLQLSRFSLELNRWLSEIRAFDAG